MNDLIFYSAMGLALLYTIISHELAHGFVAYLNGDNTAKEAGRLSLNPLAHIDPLGMLSLIVFKFGWAKPVPINPNNFNHKRWGLFATSIAGVAMNFLSAFIALFILISGNLGDESFLGIFINFLIIYGVSFGVFNLIPIPPLDGSKLIFSLLPEELSYKALRFERYGKYLLLGLVFTGALTPIIARARIEVLNFMIEQISRILG